MDNNEEEPLALLYELLVEGRPISSVHFWRSDVHYARAAIKYNLGIDLTLAKTFQYLVEEGLLTKDQK
jgi:hypothetical protein